MGEYRGTNTVYLDRSEELSAILEGLDVKGPITGINAAHVFDVGTKDEGEVYDLAMEVVGIILEASKAAGVYSPASYDSGHKNYDGSGKEANSLVYLSIEENHAAQQIEVIRSVSDQILAVLEKGKGEGLDVGGNAKPTDVLEGDAEWLEGLESAVRDTGGIVRES